jgi:hypothetical protein
VPQLGLLSILHREALLVPADDPAALAGDDYTWGKRYGVPAKKAVQRFTKDNGLRGRLRVLGSQFMIRVWGDQMLRHANRDGAEQPTVTALPF